jgi:predicted amidophosphoribosyltransferase
MPTYKHPCPQCGTFIERDAAACPACGRADPFAPSRCPVCNATLDDPGWIACPRCGSPVGAAAEAATASPAAPVVSGVAPTAPGAVEPDVASATPVPTGPARCAACGSPLEAGARFCRDCGTVVA